MGYSEFDPYRDEQRKPPVGECRECGGDLYTREAAEPDEQGRVLCGACREALDDPGYDGETVTLVLAAVDEILKGYLADGPRDEVYNLLARRFPE